MSDETVPQPVLKNAAATALVVLLLTEINPIAEHFGWWTMPAEDVLFWARLAGLVVAVFILVRGWFTHNAVTPNENVALTVKDAQVLEAAQAPAIDAADIRAIAHGSYPPYEGDEKP